MGGDTPIIINDCFFSTDRPSGSNIDIHMYISSVKCPVSVPAVGIHYTLYDQNQLMHLSTVYIIYKITKLRIINNK